MMRIWYFGGEGGKQKNQHINGKENHKRHKLMNANVEWAPSLLITFVYPLDKEGAEGNE